MAPHPAPRLTDDPDDAAPYWSGLDAGEVRLQRCVHCGRHRFPPMPSCPYCATPGGDVVAVAGEGVVYALVRVRRAFSPAFADDVPYTVAVVDLPERVRLLGVIAGDGARIGDRVHPRPVHREGWTELRFDLAPDREAS
jgi:uncharacterized OB-fold protein